MKVIIKFSTAELEEKMQIAGFSVNRRQAILELLEDPKFVKITIQALNKYKIVEIYREPGPPEEQIIVYLK